MKQQTQISIILPIYNAEKTIGETLRSIREQDFEDYEVLLVDDGSRDQSRSICLDFADKDERFRCFFQNNSGVSVARNVGLTAARGQFVVFVDADDRLAPHGLSLLLDAQHRQENCLICGCYIMNKTRNRQVRSNCVPAVYTKEKPEEFLEGLAKVPTAPWAKLYDKSLIDKHQISFPCGVPYGEDAVFLYHYMEHVQRFATISDIVYEYNFLDSGSAGRRFYKDYYAFMKIQYEARKKLCCKLGVPERSEEMTYFRRSIEHYIINEPDRAKCEKDIGLCVASFPNCVSDANYGSYASSGDMLGLIRQWIRNNRRHYWVERLKIYLDRLKKWNSRKGARRE